MAIINHFFWIKLEWKVTVRGDFFGKQSVSTAVDTVWCSFWFWVNGCNFSSQAPPVGEKKIISIFFYKMTSRVGGDVFIRFLAQMKAWEKYIIIVILI